MSEESKFPAVLGKNEILSLENFLNLEPKEQEVLYVLTGGAGTQTAAYAAVYKTRNRASAATGAYEFFNRPDVKLAVREMQALRRAEYSEIREQLIAHLIEAVSYDVSDIYDEKGVMLPIPQMPLGIRKLITGIKETKYGMHIEFADRLRAANMLMELLGIQQQSAGMTVNINLEKQETTEKVVNQADDDARDDTQGGITLKM